MNRVHYAVTVLARTRARHQAEYTTYIIGVRKHHDWRDEESIARDMAVELTQDAYAIHGEDLASTYAVSVRKIENTVVINDDQERRVIDRLTYIRP